MPPIWRNLPSLSSLRAFDATARHGGFTGAGRALNVTHAAVTQQVRGLEQELGVQLVQRTGRTVSLTEAGQRLAQTLNEGFGGIAAGIEDLRRSEKRKVLRVATTTFIAEAWIMPRLPEFWARCPGIEVALSPSHTVVDFARDGFDLAVRSLTDGWATDPATDVLPLARTPILVVCAPSLLAGGQSDPEKLPWILEAGAEWDEERLRTAGINPDVLQRIMLGSRHLEMSAARRGLGCMLATEIICRDDLKAGRLVALPVSGLPSITYAAVIPKGPRRAAVGQFVDWLATIF